MSGGGITLGGISMITTVVPSPALPSVLIDATTTNCSFVKPSIMVGVRGLSSVIVMTLPLIL